MRRKIVMLLCGFLAFNFSLHGMDIQRWVIYYSDKAPLTSFYPYQLAVFDNEHHPFLEGFAERKILTLGYISLGEISSNRPYFEDVKAEGILLDENKNWQGSYFVDLRDPQWTKRVIEEIIPSVLFQKFDGLFLDTLDDAEFLETSNPEKYKGMKAAAISLVKAIHLHYPQIKIMMNRGFALLPALAKSINMELAESTYTTYNFEKKSYQLIPNGNSEDVISLLKNARVLNPSLQIFTLDYWYPEDTAKIKEIYAAQRERGFIPYVSTITMDTIIPEPK